jgi:non-specific serine/threonine protein kinase/serine/threonine-protein kinase
MQDEITASSWRYELRADAVLQQIGPYRVIRAIGEGGMGSVFLAQQDEPVRRQVAIKVIRSPFSRAEERIRFQAEQQAMARLSHPNVAQMFEAGTTQDGYPYFVMEWIDGMSIVEYCDRRTLSVEKRLELFAAVCDGVLHAHQKSIVHRDLKPSNILVIEVDGRPLPKIIDFGVAKALDSPLVDATTLTGDGVVGTPAYVSPEAVTAGTRGDVDTRADVYALGLVLYKLLAGEQPYESPDEAMLDRMLRIANDDAPPPRQFFHSMKDGERVLIASRRATSPTALERMLRGELEAIVLKAVAKDREQRYATASEMQADVRRFLAHEPVEASAPGTWVRVRKFARRHRGFAFAAMLVIIALAAGFVARTIEARRADEARRQAELVTTFMTDLFSDTNPFNGSGQVVSVHDLLKEGSQRIKGELEDAPVARAEVLEAIGIALLHQGDRDGAYPLFLEALALRRKALGPDHPLVASTLLQLGVLLHERDPAQSERDLREAVRIREKAYGPKADQVAGALADLATTLRLQHKYAEAEKAQLRSLHIREEILPPNHPALAASCSGLGQIYDAEQRYDQAEAALLRALAIRTKAYGPDHYVTSRSYEALADHYGKLGRYADEERYSRLALKIVERVRGANHRYAAWQRVTLAIAIAKQGRGEEARPLFEQSLPALKDWNDSRGVYQDAVAWLTKLSK